MEDPVDAARACLMIGALSEGNPVERERRVAQGVAQLFRGCERGDKEACGMFGGLLLQELESLDPQSAKFRERIALASEPLTRACRGGLGLACGAMGYISETGHGQAKHDERARNFYRDGCRAGHASSCTALATLHWTVGDPTEDTQPVIEARKLHAKACDLGSMEGCEWAGHLFVSQVGGLPLDLNAALPFYQRACASDRANACMRLAVIHSQRGEPTLAQPAFLKACAGGESEACSHVDVPVASPTLDTGPF